MQRVLSQSIRPRLLARKRRTISCVPSSAFSCKVSSSSSIRFITEKIINRQQRNLYFSTTTRLKFSAVTDQEEITTTATSSLPIENYEEYPFRHQLTNFYKVTHDISSLKDAFETKMILSGNTDPSTLWTATFKCPVSGKRIPAGKLPQTEFCIEKEGDMYYKSKKTSIQAAAMEAIHYSRKLSSSSSSNNNTHGGQGGEADKVVTDSSSTTPSYSSKIQLFNWYRRNQKIKITDEMFSTRKKSLTGKTNGGIWWTASFTCPKTGQVYKSMEFETNNNIKNNNNDETLLLLLYRDSEGCWYRKKSDAIHAAAEHAIYINKLEGNDSLSLLTSSETENESLLDQDQDESTSILSEMIGSSNPTRTPLNLWYDKEHNVDLSDSNYVVSMASFKGKMIGGNWWTASFICPLSGDRFDSGSLVDVEFHKDSDGVVWYKKKEDSMVAAALSTLDTLRFKKTGVTEPRYCEEDPREGETEEPPSLLLPDLVQGKEKSIQKETIEETTHQTTSSSQSDIDDEEDFIIEIVPQRIGSTEALGPGTTATTLDLIADTWIQATNASISGDDSSKSVFQSPILERQEAIDRAMNWIASQQDCKDDDYDHGDRSWFDGQAQTMNIKIANLILESLAHANRRLPFEAKPSGVEEAASAVLTYMWSSQSMSPDANSYASFLKCLEGETPAALSKKAQKIYDSMVTGSEYKGRVLPEPDITVYNSLIQCLAGAGIETQLHEVDENLRPNRETFLSILSSMPQLPKHKDGVGTFSVDNASTCIEKMKLLSDEYNDPSLVPDIQVYNAPLCWIGGLLSASSRPYSTSIPWDSYDQIFQKGFKVLLKDHALFEEALNMQSWYESMSSGAFGEHIQPDIETYESLIQAWVRTGTREGLEKAEQFAEKLIDGKSKLIEARLQTFHPILSGWVYSGAIDGPERVEYWLKRLKDFGFPIESDGRYQLAPILARVSKQKEMLRKQDVHELANQDFSDFEILAVESSKYLTEMIESFKKDDGFLFSADAFALATQSWHNVGYVQSRMGNANGAASALTEMEEIIKQFDGMVQTLHRSDGKTSLIQLLHLLDASPKVYSAALSSLREFDYTESRRSSDGGNGSHLLKNLIRIEQNIRRSEEFRLCTEDSLARARAFDIDQQMITTEYHPLYTDLFSLPSGMLVPDTLSPTWLHFYKHVLQALQGSKISQEIESDVARICMLITDILKIQKADSDSSINEYMLQVLDKFQGDPPGQNILFESVKNVYQVPQQRRKRAAYPLNDKSTTGSRKVTSTTRAQEAASSKRGLRRRRGEGRRKSLQHTKGEYLSSKKKQHASN